MLSRWGIPVLIVLFIASLAAQVWLARKPARRWLVVVPALWLVVPWGGFAAYVGVCVVVSLPLWGLMGASPGALAAGMLSSFLPLAGRALLAAGALALAGVLARLVWRPPSDTTF